MKIKLLKVGAAWCGPCQALARNRTLEKFAEKHEGVTIEVHDDSMNGSAVFEKFANKWNVKSLPTLIWLYRDEELLRSGDVSARGIAEQYEKAIRKVEKL